MNRGFWFRFVILLGIALFPLLLLAALSSPNSNNLKEIAQRTARELDRLIQLREQQVFTMAAFPSVRAFASSPPDARAQRASVTLNELKAWVASDTNVREAFITDAHGTIIMTTLDGWNSGASQREFVQEALRGQLAVSPISQDRNEFSTYYAAPILDNTQNIAGALVIRVAAQEMWSVTPRGENLYAIIADENGVRLDDTGDPKRRLTSFAPLEPDRAARIVEAQTYGAQLLAPRPTNLERAQELITRGAVDELRASDVNADAFAVQRLLSKMWYVLILAPQSTFVEIFSRLIVPVLAALLLACGGAFLLPRL